MHKAIDIANFFIDLTNSMDECHITNMKVNKLVYFAQAWSMVKYNKKLFDENIEAWKYGPVIPSVYNAFKICGSQNIAATYGDYNQDIFSSEELDLLVDVALTYGKYEAFVLRDMTHEDAGPWDRVYEERKNNVIPDELIKNYYSKSKHSLPDYELKSEAYVGYHDEDGHLVLPKEWDDDNV